MSDNDWAQQVAMNENVFATLISSGEDLSDGRHVIHYLYGGDIPALSEALRAQGYVVSPTATRRASLRKISPSPTRIGRRKP